MAPFKGTLMRLSSITLSILCALLLCSYAPNASAHNEDEYRKDIAPTVANPNSLYIELINENEVVLDNRKLSLAELKEFLKDNPRNLPEQMTILYITDTQFVNQAYQLAFALERINQKHIWVTYKPNSLY